MSKKNTKVKIVTSSMGTSSYGNADKKWFLRFAEDENERSVDPLMGWTSIDSSKSQLKLRFDSKESAIEYAKSQGYEYSVQEDKKRKVLKKSYTSNFID